MACTAVDGGRGENVLKVYYFSEMFLRGGRKRLLEGVKWGEKGVLEGKRGVSGLFWGVQEAGEMSKLCQVIVAF
jgi:hypothetical protein